MTATTGDWVFVGFDDEKANATTRIAFQLTLAPAYAGAPFTGSTRLTATWTGGWSARRASGSSDCPLNPGVSGGLTGSAPVTVQGSHDPARPDELQLGFELLTHLSTETLQGIPKACEPWLTPTAHMLSGAFFDCNEKAACSKYPRAGGARTFGAGGAQLGVIARTFLSSKGRYDLSAQLTLVSETRR